MGKFIKTNYYILVRILLMLIYSLYGFMTSMTNTGVSIKVLLLVSFYISLMTIKELMPGRKKLICFAGAFIIIGLLIHYGGKGFILMAILLIFEILSYFKVKYYLYFLIYLVMFIESFKDPLTEFVVITMLMIFYLQHEFVVEKYEKQMYEDIVLQQGLKRDYEIREYEVKAELKKNMLKAENQVLEERAALSQTLHDKLGHNINGSIYQLEGVKILMDKEPEKSRSMIQAVIDQLRTGMDEIRAILRKERPEKKELALLQLYKLCEDCNGKGVETVFSKEGDISQISDELWEVILDNAFEAVSNSMKYARCRHIDINLVIMNRMLRCSIKDDGIGCKEINDGMGISGMRQRVRKVNGTLSFETEAGFMVTMLLPM